ncbi:MAG: hypothetical protein HN542_01610 [Flavobacteriales bacterium]|jgi:hypothetical protein|nr:hypothetical protein [Flavobacteriales bacterium]NCG29429.1 hypothetical protein [Bacteroidota bacterium]MBT3963108.1 hypothetical protein [Flavobacteriales bacterium]MBT4930683.1 hypothetical protein [Flavobacteriales bacterium]MBT5133363.1 hypothetical protein [Flavobacteriales bacterium]
MKVRLLVLFWVLFIGICSSSEAQVTDVPKQVLLSSDTIQLDTNSIIPGTFALVGLDSNDYIVDFAKGLLVLIEPSSNRPKSVDVTYQTFPFNFTRPFKHKETSLIGDPQRVYNPFKSTGGKSKTSKVLDLGEIEKRGSISRGISVGNNQNLSINSSLNLQLAGQLNERFTIAAAIADQNIPIQPEGNTQQLQDFDQVYIQVYDDDNRLTAGDFQIVRKQGYFMQFNKRLQGGRIESQLNSVGKDSTASVKLEASGAVSRGKFARKTIQGIEGNQGPYRLTGADGEPFIVVLSGTERVYLDGRLLVRGQEHDYVINYNTSEITFTAKLPITKDRRIVAEYQYSDRNYARSLVYGSAEYESENAVAGVSIYSEQDAKNQPLQQELTSEQKDILRTIGDDVNAAIAPGTDSIPFSENQILYNRKDSLYYDQALGDSVLAKDVLVYSSDPKTAFVQATFSNVGEGMGDYIFSRQLAFGRVYEWVAPVNGVPQGSFAPVVKLVTPKQRQMIVAHGEMKINDRLTIQGEWAGSSNDVNTFSSVDGSDDLGMAAKIRLKGEQPLSGKWKALASADYEFLQRNFQQIERFRTVEFDRDWNIRDLTVNDNQNVLGALLGISREKELELAYGIKSFTAGSSFGGIQNLATIKANHKRVRGNFAASQTQQEGDLVQSKYYQHNNLWRLPIWNLELGFKDDFEENKRFDPITDTLSSLAFKFWEWQASISTPDSFRNGFELSYAERTDWLKNRARLDKATFARIYGFEVALNKSSNSALLLKTNYRTLDILNEKLTAQQVENTLLSRIEYRARVFKSAITSSTFYEIGSGLENRREYIYIETTPGQGTHIHIDYNGNGDKELDEFELAVQADQVASANYLKVFVPTSDYVKVFRNQFTQSLYLRPATIWRKETGFLKFLSYFSDQFSYSADRKTFELPLLEQFNPFQFDVADTLLQSINSNLRNIFYFNQSHPVFGADLTIQRLESRNLLTSGFESRSTEKMSPGIRWNLSSVLSLNVRGEQGWNTSTSDAGLLASRNFRIYYRSIEPRFSLQPTPKWRITLLYEYKEQDNRKFISDANPGDEQAITQRGGLEFTLSSPEKGNLLASINLVDIAYSGKADSPVGFTMLDGLQPGTNTTWGVSYQRTLASNLQINLNYNGRRSPGLKVIHTGGIEARAFF